MQRRGRAGRERGVSREARRKTQRETTAGKRESAREEREEERGERRGPCAGSDGRGERVHLVRALRAKLRAAVLVQVRVVLGKVVDLFRARTRERVSSERRRRRSRSSSSTRPRETESDLPPRARAHGATSGSCPCSRCPPTGSSREKALGRTWRRRQPSRQSREPPCQSS